MIDLNKEAEKVLCYLFPDNEIMTRKQYNNALGAIKSIANSKYVKQQIIQAQIDILRNLPMIGYINSKIITKVEHIF